MVARRGAGRTTRDPPRPSRRPRGATLEVPRAALPADRRGRVLRLRACRPRGGRGGRTCARPGRRGSPGLANDALDLDDGLLLPLVAACVVRRRSRGAAYPGGARILRPRLILCVSMSSPSFRMPIAWLTEQRPVAAVLGGELDLRLFSYRETTPAPLGQRRRRALRRRCRDGAAGRRRRGRARGRLRRAARPARDRAHARRDARSPRRSSRSSPARSHLTLLSARFEGFDERIVEHLCIGRDLDRAVRPLERRPAGDGGRSTRSPAGSRGRSPTARVRWSRSRRSSGAALEYPHYTRPPEFRGWRVPDVLLSGDHGRIERWRKEHVR